MNVREITEKKVFHYMEEHNMIAAHDKIVVGVSGGADSVCLLYLLLEYARKTPLSLSVVHVNHGIRVQAGEDAAYVEALCAQEGLPFFLTNADVHGMAMEKKCSEEDMGRRVRYEAFRRAADQLGGALTAVAHNSNDNAETMLFHLFRGSGLKGLSGITPVREGERGKIIRPILCLERAEVEAYLAARQIPWCRDDTNNQDGYCRNRIRHHILPYAEQEVVQGAVGCMSRTAEMLREAEAYLEQQTQQALAQCMKEDMSLEKQEGSKRYIIVIDKFVQYHIALQRRMLFYLLKQLSPKGKDIALVNVRDVLFLVQKEGNRSISLPFGILARRQYGLVVIENGEPNNRMRLWMQETVEIPWGEDMGLFPYVCCLSGIGKMEFSIIFLENGPNVPKNLYTKWFDYDKIEEPLVIRPRRRGDFLTISDGKGGMAHKSLKDYMITEKIPKQIRDKIPVIAAQSHVLWLAGWRISEYFKVQENTKRVLQVKLIQDKQPMDGVVTKDGG